jgi:hypothetical protein
MIWRIVTVLCLGCMAIAGCSRTDVAAYQQERIFLDYLLSYNASTDTTQLYATYRFDKDGGQALRITPHAYTEAIGINWQFDPLALQYRATLNGWVDTASIRYYDLNNNMFFNRLANKMVQFPVELDTINPNFKFTFLWEGTPLDTSEYVVLTIQGETAAEVVSVTQSTVGTLGFTMQSPQFIPLKSDTTYWSMTRVTPTRSVQTPKFGGNIRGEYIAPRKMVILKK